MKHLNLMMSVFKKLKKNGKNSGPKVDPCVTPHLIFTFSDS